MPRTLALSLLVLSCLVLAPAEAGAYIGPGAGISAIGTVVAFLGALLFAVVGFVWYPVKRLLALLRRGRVRSDDDPPQAST